MLFLRETRPCASRRSRAHCPPRSTGRRSARRRCHLPAGAATARSWPRKFSSSPRGTLRVRHLIELPNAQHECAWPRPHAAMAALLRESHPARFQQPAIASTRAGLNHQRRQRDRPARRPLAGTVLLDSVESWCGQSLGNRLFGRRPLALRCPRRQSRAECIDRPGLQHAMARDTEHRALDDLSFLRPCNDACLYLSRTPHRGACWRASLGGGLLQRLPLSVELSPGPLRASCTPSLSPALPLSEERRGEMAFHDASHCFSNAELQFLSSGRPRPTALNWDSDERRRTGQCKNTKVDAAYHQSSPAMWLGVRQDAPAAVRRIQVSFRFACR